MILEKDFFCQFTSYSNPDIAKRMCGTTSVAMVLSAHNKLYRFVTSSRNLDNLFKYLLDFHKNDVPVVKRPFVFEDDTIYVTVGLPNEVTMLEGDILSNDTEFAPYFSLVRGYDHRFSKNLFSNFNIKAEAVEQIDSNYIFDKLSSRKTKYFLASLQSKSIDALSSFRSSHIVVVHNAYISSNEKYVEYVDCSESDYILAKKSLPINEFEKIFLGRGTEIKN